MRACVSDTRVLFTRCCVFAPRYQFSAATLLFSSDILFCEVRFVPSVFVISSVDTIISLVRYDGLSYLRIRIGNATGKLVRHEIVLFSK